MAQRAQQPPMGFYTVRIADDRNQPVVLYKSRAALPARESDPALYDAFERIGGLLNPKSVWQQRYGWRYLRLFLLMLVVAITAAVGGATLGWRFNPFFLLFPVFVTIPLLEHRSRIRRESRHICDAFLTEGICPSCYYRLREVPAAEDGCVQCPECGAAWSSTRIPPAHAVSQAMRANHHSQGASGSTGFRIPRRLLVVRDSQGSAIRIQSPLLRRLDPETAAAIGVDRAGVVRSRVLSESRRVRMFIAVFGLPVLVLYTVAIIAGTLVAGTTMQPTLKLVVVLLVAAFFAFGLVNGILLALRSAFGPAVLDAERVAAAFLDNNLCPGCATPIDPATPEHPVRTCPLCSAAWKSTLSTATSQP